MDMTPEVLQKGAEGIVAVGVALASAIGVAKHKSITSEIRELYRVHAEQRRDELKPLEDQVQTVSGKVDLLVDRQASIGQRIDKLEASGDETRDIVVRLETAMGAHDQRAKDTRADINHRMDRLDDRLAKHIEANA